MAIAELLLGHAMGLLNLVHDGVGRRDVLLFIGHRPFDLLIKV